MNLYVFVAELQHLPKARYAKTFYIMTAPFVSYEHLHINELQMALRRSHAFQRKVADTCHSLADPDCEARSELVPTPIIL